MGEGGEGEGEGFSPSALSLFRFHLSPFPQKRLILRLLESWSNDIKKFICMCTDKYLLLLHW